jgi:hypothetical protein
MARPCAISERQKIPSSHSITSSARARSVGGIVPPHSITSSAATSRAGGTFRPSAFAARRLTSVSYFGRYLYRKVGRIGAVQDPVNVGCRLPSEVTPDKEAHQAAGRPTPSPEPVLGCQRGQSDSRPEAFWPSNYPSLSSPCRSPASRAFVSGSFSARAINTPTRRTRSLCCARAIAGHVAAPPKHREIPAAARPSPPEMASCASNECFDRG